MAHILSWQSEHKLFWCSPLCQRAITWARYHFCNNPYIPAESLLLWGIVHHRYIMVGDRWWRVAACLRLTWCHSIGMDRQTLCLTRSLPCGSTPSVPYPYGMGWSSTHMDLSFYYLLLWVQFIYFQFIFFQLYIQWLTKLLTCFGLWQCLMNISALRPWNKLHWKVLLLSFQTRHTSCETDVIWTV